MSVLYLLLSVFLSCARNILSKNISDIQFGTKRFFGIQATTFFSGSFVLLLLSGGLIRTISSLTILYALLYGIFLLSAQYCYTIALKNGKVGICSTIYSFGFIIPTISGCLFWHESLTILNGIGILLVIPTILLSSTTSTTNESNSSINVIFPLIIAMLSSGGLGVLQKIQQISPYPKEKTIFIILAFAFAGLISFLISCFVKNNSEEKLKVKKFCFSCGIGIAFGGSNLLNTMLAGLLPISTFTPILNTSTILFSLIAGVILFHERLSRKDYFVLLLGVLSILLITLA